MSEAGISVGHSLERKRLPTAGSWKPGQSGNPTGRPAGFAEVAVLAREAAPLAIEGLVYWAKQRDPKTARASVAACEALLNRGWGRPTQPLEMTKSIDQEVREVLKTMTDAELAGLESLVNRLLGRDNATSLKAPLKAH